MTSYYKRAAMSGLILQFAYNYTDDNRLKLNNYHDMLELYNYLKKQNLVERFATYADHNGLQRRNLMIRRSHKLLDQYINSRIIYNMLDEEAWNEYLNLYDDNIAAALRVFARHAAFPKKPASKPRAAKGKKIASLAPNRHPAPSSAATHRHAHAKK